MKDTSVDLEALTRALRRLGWHQVGTFRETLRYWEESSAAHRRDTSRVILPYHGDAVDAEDLIVDAMHVLRSQAGPDFDVAMQTALLMTKRHLDEVEVRRETDGEPGLIQWQLGNDMVDTTRQILSAAAKATNSKKRRFYNAESVISEEFLSQCYMGQTKVGSYIVTALTPGNSSVVTSRSAAARKSDRVSSRAVTETLVGSLDAIRESLSEARKDQKLDVFEYAVASGVSYELLSALEPLTTAAESGVTVSLYHEHPNAAAVHQGPAAHFGFTPEDGAIIQRVRQHFEEPGAISDVHLTGEVTLLKNSSRGNEHRIKLHADVLGKPRVVTVALTPEQYSVAVSAHSEERPLTVVGQLEDRKRSAILRSAKKVYAEDSRIGESPSKASLTF